MNLSDKMRKRLRNLDRDQTEEEVLKTARKITVMMATLGYNKRTRKFGVSRIQVLLITLFTLLGNT